MLRQLIQKFMTYCVKKYYQRAYMQTYQNSNYICEDYIIFRLKGFPLYISSKILVLIQSLSILNQFIQLPMPPKKQEQQASGPYLVWNILPVFCAANSAVEALRKPVNIKKSLELPKIIEILKQKGIDKYIQEGQLSEEGYQFISQNLLQATNEYIAQLRKPADPKKDQKKDTKKDSKKEQSPPEEAEKIIQFAFEKTVNEFLVFLDFPKDQKTLRTAIQSGWKVDVVVWIQQMIKQSSRLPNYELLNNHRSIDDFLNQINSTSPKPREEQNFKASKTQKDNKTQIIAELKKLKVLKIGDLQQTIIVQIPYLRDLQHPENDATEFLSIFFKRLCELTLNRNKFQAWKKEQQVSDMVPTIKEKIKKEVVVEEKKDEKKGGKKDPNAQPQIQIIEQIIQKRYEDMPENAKSNLAIFNNISKHRKNNPLNTYDCILDNMALSISQQTQRAIQVQKTNILDYGTTFIQKQRSNHSNKITIQSISNRMPKIRNCIESIFLRHAIKMANPYIIQNQISLAALLKYSPMNRSLQFQYKLELFDRTMKNLQTKLTYSFQDRVYAEKLDQCTLNGRINLELDLQPRVYLAQTKVDQFKILILARVNPPGRVFYQNTIFDWKVLPNFQFWQKQFKDHNHNDKKYWNYDWRNAGNLKILTKKLMPTDNVIITESIFVAGDSQHKILNLTKDETFYELKSINGQNIFSKQTIELHLDAFTQQQQASSEKRILLAVRKTQFTVLFDDSPTIFWSQHPLQEKRHFGTSAQVTKYLKNGSIIILYPNGNCSSYQFGEWKHIRNNKLIEGDKQVDLKIIHRTDGDKKIAVRQDETVFVDFPNGDQLILYKDGTIFTHISSSNTIQISNQCGLIVRKIFPKSKDINVIGTGSAFAFLGQTNILQRSFDGSLLELHHSTFTWHSYTECVDRDGKITKESVKMMTFRDGSMLKINQAGLLTFLHQNQSQQYTILHERWLQLFTNPEYHGQGVYDVDLIQGSISTKDRQSNIFKLSLKGDSDVRIAVSFNINNSQEEVNNYGNGYHVPEQNYFLPPPQNRVTPRLFLIHNDGSGEQFLTQEQVCKLKGYKMNRVSTENQSFIQLTKQNSEPNSYYSNRFSKGINLSRFDLPAVLKQETKHVNLIPSRFNDIIFKNLEEIVWDKQFKKLKQITNAVHEQRGKYNEQLQRLRKKA